MTTAELASISTNTDTSSLVMVRADMDIREFHRWVGMRGLISRGAFDEGFAMHCLLVESFGELAPRPFRVIIPAPADSVSAHSTDMPDVTPAACETPPPCIATHSRRRYCPLLA